MRKIIDFASEHPWSVLIALLVLTMLAATRIGGLRINISAESMIAEDDPARALYERTRRFFPDEKSLIVFLRDPDLFSPAKLEVIRNALNQIEALPFVSSTQSLFSLKNIKSVDGEITSEPFLEAIPQNPRDADRIRRDALFNPLIRGNLFSDDGKAMAVKVSLTDDPEAAHSDKSIVVAIDEILRPLSGALTQAFQIGTPYLRQTITEKIRSDQRNILPWSLSALFLTLMLTLRRLNGAIIPLVTAAISIIWTLASMAALNIPLNVMTSIVPALLIIIGSTEDVHLLAEYYAGIRRGLDKQDALYRMSRNMGTAILLTCITTYLGFVSIATNNIMLLQQFGVVASTGILFNFLITALLVPAWLRLLDKSKAVPWKAAHKPNLFQQSADRIFRLVQSNKRTTFASAFGIALIASYGAWQMRVDNDPMGYFDGQEPLTQRAASLHEHLAGMHGFSVVLRSDIEGTFLKIRYLEELEKLQNYLDSTGLFDKSLSFSNLVALVNAILEEDDSGEFFLPASDDIVRELMLLVDRKDVAEYVSEDYSQTRILVRHNIGSSYALNQALKKIQSFATTHIDPGLQVYITGESILRARAADSIAAGQAKSLLLMVFVIWLIISLLFVNMKAGLLAVAPNLLPVLVLFGTMGYLHIPLDTSTAMIAAIALGICVDDTMHFMVRYHLRTRAHGDEKRALNETVREEAVPMISTSMALALGFAVLGLSSFPPVVHFGLLSAMVILLALLATFIIFPILLSSVRLITLYELLTLQLEEEVLRHCDLFHGMRRSQIKKLVLVSEVRAFNVGELIVREGELGDEMFVILKGEVEVAKTQEDGACVNLREMATGQVFGEMALLANTSRTASVSAKTATKTLTLKWACIRRIARLYPRISSKLFLNLSSILSTRLAGSPVAMTPLVDQRSGIVSKAYFDELLAREIHRAERYAEPLSLVSLRFEQAQAPTTPDDQFRTMIFELLPRWVRKADVVACSHNGRMLFLLPKTNHEQARLVADRIHRNIEPYSARNTVLLEIRLGVVQYKQGESMTDFLTRALPAPG